MKYDTRLTLALALIYFLNGLMNLFGDAKSYMPFFFLDYFLLSFLAISFIVIKPFQVFNLSFILFSLIYFFFGLISFPGYKNDSFEFILLVVLFVLNSFLYSVFVWLMFSITALALLIGILYLAICVVGFLNLNGAYSVILSVVLLVLQVLLLSLPSVIQNLNITIKRYLLLNCLFFAFEINRYIFFKLYM